MQIIEIIETVIKTIKTSYVTDCGIELIKTVVDDEFKDISIIGTMPHTYPMLLNIPKNYFIDTYEQFNDLYKLNIKLKSVGEFNENNLYYLYTAGNMLFDKNENIVSLPHRYSYCNTQLYERIPHDPLFNKLMELLKNHPYVLKLELDTIPEYNSSFYGQIGIMDMKVHIPQNVYEAIYAKYKNINNWSLILKDIIGLCNTDFNLYGYEILKLYNDYIQVDEYIENEDKYGY
jgi:hypothetical protein